MERPDKAAVDLALMLAYPGSQAGPNTATVLGAEVRALREKNDLLRKVLLHAIETRVADYGDAWEGEGEPPDETPNGGSYDEYATQWWRAYRETEP